MTFSAKRARLINCHDLRSGEVFTSSKEKNLSYIELKETFALVSEMKKNRGIRLEEFTINYSISVSEVRVGEIFKSFQLHRAGVLCDSLMLSDDSIVFHPLNNSTFGSDFTLALLLLNRKESSRDYSQINQSTFVFQANSLTTFTRFCFLCAAP